MKNYGEGIYYIDPKLRISFQERVLSRQWREDYPFLFDEEDLILALHQSSNHFYEWYAAIQIYKDMKYLCLVEKYQFKKHKEQRKLYESIVPSDIVSFIDSKDFGGRQAPDLLAYSPDTLDWFFCEVKGGKDRFHKGQEEAFEKLVKVSRKEILIMKIKPKEMVD